jgi:hypothetical protein
MHRRRARHCDDCGEFAALMIEPDCKRAEELLRSVLLSNRLSAVETTAPNTWDFQFSGAHLNVSVPWRILDGESIRMGSCDHDQKFGLPQPIGSCGHDGVARSKESGTSHAGA